MNGMSKIDREVRIIVKAVNRAADQLLELQAMTLANKDGRRWASLTGWQRDKYRRAATAAAKALDSGHE